MICREFYNCIEFFSSTDPENQDLLSAIECLERQGILSDAKICRRERVIWGLEQLSTAIQHFQICTHCQEYFLKTKHLDLDVCKIFSKVIIPMNLADRIQQRMHSSLQIEQFTGQSFEATIQQILDHSLEDFRELLSTDFASNIEETIQEIFGNSIQLEDILPNPEEISKDLILIGVRKSWIFDNHALGVFFKHFDKKIIMHVFDLAQANLFYWDGRIQIKEYDSLQHAVWMHAPLVFALVSNLSAPQAKQMYTRFYR